MLVNVARLLSFVITARANTDKPTVMEVYKYIASISNVGQWDMECYLVMAVLVSRYVGTAAHSNVKLHSHNWHFIVLVAFMIAQKLLDDVPLGNAEFVKILRIISPTCEPEPNKTWAGVDLSFINDMERSFLGIIHFDVFIKRKVYIEFMLELNAFQGAFQGHTSMQKPLSAIQARAIGLSLAGNSQQLATQQKGASMGVEDLVMRGLAVLS
jgi:hypothetical protein